MDPVKAARAFHVHGHKFTKDEQATIRRRIRSHSATLNLAVVSQTSSAQGETGKTRSQPRQYGGRFGVKGFGGAEAPTFTPKQISEAIDNLRPGQSISLPNNAGKIKRLTNGFQVVMPNGANVTVANAQAAATRANSMVKSKGGQQQ